MKQSPALRQKTCRVTMRARGTERRKEGRNSVCVCVCVCVCGLYFTSVDADMCKQHQGSASYLMVQLTGQVCVPPPFILGSVCVCVCVFRWVRYSVQVRTFTFHFASLSFFLPLCAALFLSSQLEVTVQILIILSYLIPSGREATQEMHIWHWFLKCVWHWFKH